MVDSSRNRGTDGFDAKIREPKGTGTEVLAKLEPVQELEPKFKNRGYPKRPVLVIWMENSNEIHQI